jgi:hypothetical protein
MNQSDKDMIAAAENAAFEKNNKDYWDAHIQFGSDPELRCAWFHGVGFDAGRAFERERASGLRDKAREFEGIAHDVITERNELRVRIQDLLHALKTFFASGFPRGPEEAKLEAALERFGEVSE